MSLYTFIYSKNCMKNVPATSSLNEDMPGLTYTADQQCNMTFGNDAVLCRVSDEHNIIPQTLS